MRKLVIGLIITALLAFNTSALAWDVDVNIAVQDSNVGLSASATTDNYTLRSAAGVDGTGVIGIHGAGDAESGHLLTGVSGTGNLYAANGLESSGNLGSCNDCPDYDYDALSYASINGQGTIILAQATGYDFKGNNSNIQVLFAKGEGEFKSGMMSSFLTSDMDEPMDHAMGAYGDSVSFSTLGIQVMNTDNGENSGMFTSNLKFND